MPNSGLSICLTFNHVAADGKSLHHFMKFWASVSKNRVNNNVLSLEESLPMPPDLPSHERDRVKDPKGLKHIYLKELQDFDSKNLEFAGLVRDSYVNKIRTTLVLSFGQVQKLKKWVAEKCKESHGGTQHVAK
ncbi:hypothetical protein TSUD_105250 [Trifolium subterraneum]|uniref:Uncharacterized protein n=1 Tax=Trifolium subterraneum TaxID=3900 RepID=A0A2Z6N4H9_TRISU|nr:hypothetical protein TSUD_105250 [Trifolium subterraneum]